METTQKEDNGNKHDESESQTASPVKQAVDVQVVRVISSVKGEKGKIYQVMKTVTRDELAQLRGKGEKISEVMVLKRRDSLGSDKSPQKNALSERNSVLKPIISYKCSKCQSIYVSQAEVLKHMREAHVSKGVPSTPKQSKQSVFESTHKDMKRPEIQRTPAKSTLNEAGMRTRSQKRCADADIFPLEKKPNEASSVQDEHVETLEKNSSEICPLKKTSSETNSPEKTSAENSVSEETCAESPPLEDTSEEDSQPEKISADTTLVKTEPSASPDPQNSQISDPSKLHQCNICNITCESKLLLYKHYGEDHRIDNPYLRNKKVITKQPKPRSLQCETCGTRFASAHGLRRHNVNIHASPLSKAGICHHCGNKFKLASLKGHELKCGQHSSTRRRQFCFYDGCNISYYRKEELIRHVKEDHNMHIEPMRTLRFKNDEGFKRWKLEEEDRTYSYYSKHAGTKKSIHTYYCQHEGTERYHKRTDDAKESVRQNKKGRIKKGQVCTSYLRAKMVGSEIVAYYHPTHNHPISPDDVKHQPLSKETIKFIKDQIALNVPCRQIQTMVKKWLAETGGANRDAQVISLKRITSMAQRYQRYKNPQAPNAALESFNSFIDVLSAQEDSPVLFYQPPTEDVSLDGPNQGDQLYFLGLQTVDQQKMLQREKASPLFISVTKSEFTLQYYILSILVPCEDNFEYPVGHLISSQINEEVVSLFLQTVGERCPDLNVNCIVSVDCPEIIAAIKTVFGQDGPYFLSKWHFLEFMRKDFLKIVPSNKVEELYDFILAMTEAENEERFLFLYNSFKEQYEPAFPDVISNFAEYLVRAVSWATCYRQPSEIPDSCLYADSFFAKFNKKYRRRPSKGINLLPDLLLSMQETYRDKRENNEILGVNEEMMKEQHLMALEVPPDLVQETLSRHWNVQASKHGQAFLVMQCLERCPETDCLVKCRDCISLCSHMFFCTCGMTDSICSHVHKVYQLYGPPMDAEDVCATATIYITQENERIEEERIENAGMNDGEVEDERMEVCVSPNEVEGCSPADEIVDQSVQLIEAEALRGDVIMQIDAIREVVEQRCVPEEAMVVIHDTLKGLVELISKS